MKKRLYVDIHVLQTVPPSCVNRDDTGSPKTAVYGGVTRARVSSQSWKHAMRNAFLDNGLFDAEDIGKRTKKVQEMIADEIRKLDAEKDAEKLAKKAFEYIGTKNDDQGAAKTLLFISYAQAKALAKLVVSGCSDKQEYKAAFAAEPSVDMALFGRMVAVKKEDGISFNYDAAAQVAHSISTHAVQNEYDYFTAVDDLAEEDNAGAGHLGTSEYNSSTLYRYATVNVMELEKQLGRKKAAKTVKGFATAFILSMPTGKQNSYANRTLPDAVYVTIREDQPINLCGAFEKAVPMSADGYAEASKRKLVSHAEYVYGRFAEPPAKSFVVGDGLDALGAQDRLSKVLTSLEETVLEMLDENEVE